MKKKGNFLLFINILLTLIIFGYFVLNILIMYNIYSLDELTNKLLLIIIGLVSFICLLFSIIIYTNKGFVEKLSKILSNEEAVVKEFPIVEEQKNSKVEEVIENTKLEEETNEAIDEVVLENEIVEEASLPIIEEVEQESLPLELETENVKSFDLSKLKYEGKLMYAPIKIKEYYSIIKNHLLAYTGVSSRISNNKETFRKSGMIAQIRLVNNKLYVYLAVIPEPFISEGYKVTNVSNTKQYEETPTLIKIANDKLLKQFVDILDVMMTDKGINIKQRFKEVNYVDYLYPNGEAILNGIGLSSEYLVNSINPKILSNDLPDNLLDYAATINGEELGDEVYKTSIYLDNLALYFSDGDIITKESLVNKKLIKKGDYVSIKGRGTLDKRFIIHADDFDVLATKMIYITNGTIVLIKH